MATRKSTGTGVRSKKTAMVNDTALPHQMTIFPAAGELVK